MNQKNIIRKLSFHVLLLGRRVIIKKFQPYFQNQIKVDSRKKS